MFPLFAFWLVYCLLFVVYLAYREGRASSCIETQFERFGRSGWRVGLELTKKNTVETQLRVGRVGTHVCVVNTPLARVIFRFSLLGRSAASVDSGQIILDLHLVLCSMPPEGFIRGHGGDESADGLHGEVGHIPVLRAPCSVLRVVSSAKSLTNMMWGGTYRR